MEIFYYEASYPSIMALPIAFIIIGLGLMGTMIALWLCDEEWDTPMVVGVILGVILLISGIIWSCNIEEDVYVYGRVNENQSFTEINDRYEYIEDVEGVYKFRVKEKDNGEDSTP